MRPDSLEDSRVQSGGRRSIEAILQRRRRRRRRRRHTRAPDFVHGNCQLDVVYGNFGRRWVESTAFAEVLRDGKGRPTAWTLATFDEGFLTLRHALDWEVDALDDWVAGRLPEGIRRAVVLDLDEEREDVADITTQLPEALEVVAIACGAERLRELEQIHLDVTRDRRFPGRDRLSSATDELLLESRLNVTSAMCLCATLI